MTDDDPLTLDEDLDAPEVVTRAAKRFRRRLLVGMAAVAVLALGIGVLLAHEPGDATPRGRLEPAATRHEAGGQLCQGSLTLTVLEAGRVSDGVFVSHLVGAAEDLADREALHLSVPVNTLLPPPGEEPPDLPGNQVQTRGLEPDDPGYGAGRHVTQAWVALPAGTRTVPVVFAAGVPLDEPPPQQPPPGEEGGQSGGDDELLHQEGGETLPLPPTVEGTARHLDTIDVDLQELGIPDEIWAEQPR